ncbi:hypothetical protein AB0G02_01250 [Actinosynnema sp. NPDC023658]|uniref:hypothetical protein n=1 Tax=Actinosynnema sp. NPDC023658 TaxID=3155465 RepID=UPI0033DD8101
MKIRSAATFVVAAALVVGCTPNTSSAPEVNRSQGTTTEVVAPTMATTTTISPTPAVTAPVTAGTCTVPDVVGMVHQHAQDTMQAAGLFNLREEDATGQGRVLVLDRNWTTTAQSVAAGQVVDCTTEILLSAKKIGE